MFMNAMQGVDDAVNGFAGGLALVRQNLLERQARRSHEDAVSAVFLACERYDEAAESFLQTVNMLRAHIRTIEEENDLLRGEIMRMKELR